jgi:hypothetical protein
MPRIQVSTSNLRRPRRAVRRRHQQAPAADRCAYTQAVNTVLAAHAGLADTEIRAIASGEPPAGVAAKRDPSLAWLWSALAPLPPAQSAWPAWSFECKLAPEVLGEQPRQTSIAFFVDDPATLLCIEAKWIEDGIGACGCAKERHARPRAVQSEGCSTARRTGTPPGTSCTSTGARSANRAR